MILGTAGHIDHGKTTLVRALTGVDTDRLPEEKRRGITIELGFAPLQLEGVGTVGVVDVPGHEAFVRTMLAGATGVDIALLVIAADEGPMPQTREHLAILSLLGVHGGVVALTKSDLVDDAWCELVEEEVRALLEGTPLAEAPIVRCSATTGAGLPELRSALIAAAAKVPARHADDLLRLPIDRVFTVKGTGTVVTGTLWSGTVAREDSVVLLDWGRSAVGRGRALRVRGVEQHSASVATAEPGSRVALALAGVDHDELSRGDVLVRAEEPWQDSGHLRADLALLEGANSIGPRTKVRLHIGTREVGARVVSREGRVEPGATVTVRLATDAPVFARAGDRFVLRSASPLATIGGGVITDPWTTRRSKPWPHPHAKLGERLGWLVQEGGARGLPVAELPLKLGVTPGQVATLLGKEKDVVPAADRLFAKALRTTLRNRLKAKVEEHHRLHPLEPGMPREAARAALATTDALFDDLLADLAGKGVLQPPGKVLARVGFDPTAAAGDAALLDEIAARLEAGGAEPPGVDELTATFGPRTPALLRLLVSAKRAVAVSPERYYGADALRALERRLADFTRSNGKFTASQIRESLELSRKYLIPFLEYCDRVGYSRRDGDYRTFRWPEPKP
jgi:selenocysteine-specific elongation factor